MFSVLFAFENLHIRRVVNMPLRKQGEADAISKGFVHFVSIAAHTHGADRQDWTDFFYLKRKENIILWIFSRFAYVKLMIKCCLLKNKQVDSFFKSPLPGTWAH